MRPLTRATGAIALVLTAMLSFEYVHLSADDPVTSVRRTGDPSNRVDLVVLGDGYTAGELGQYAADVESFLDGFFLATPFAEYGTYFNVHRIDVVSNESGVDHPEQIPQLFRDTALDAAYNCGGIQRLVCISPAKVNAMLASSVLPDMRDIVMVLVNDAQYGGSGGAITVGSTHRDVIEIVLHEMGHSFGLLADEYGGPPPPECNATREPAEANATAAINRGLAKWSLWIDPETAIPTTLPVAGLPGLYEGAAYCDTGLFRPTHDSKMRSLFRPFEQINNEQLVKRVYNWAAAIDAALPDERAIRIPAAANQTFRVQLLEPLTHPLDAVWSIDGVEAGSGPEFTLNAWNVGAGFHTVDVAVSDPTVLVRNDPAGVLTDSHTWEVEIEPAAARPDLVHAALSNPPATLLAGRRFTVTDTVQNHGEASAASTATTYYLSLDREPDAGDWQLVRTRIVGELAPGEFSDGAARLRVPPGLAPATYFLLACADGYGIQEESIEDNNCRASDTPMRVRAGE
jgi:hypothetical protein